MGRQYLNRCNDKTGEHVYVYRLLQANASRNSIGEDQRMAYTTFHRLHAASSQQATYASRIDCTIFYVPKSIGYRLHTGFAPDVVVRTISATLTESFAGLIVPRFLFDGHYFQISLFAVVFSRCLIS